MAYIAQQVYERQGRARLIESRIIVVATHRQTSGEQRAVREIVGVIDRSGRVAVGDIGQERTPGRKRLAHGRGERCFRQELTRGEVEVGREGRGDAYSFGEGHAERNDPGARGGERIETGGAANHP